MQRKQEVAEMNSRRLQLEQSLSLARDELAILAPLVQKGVMPRIDLLRIERQVSDLEGEIRTIRTAIPPLESAPKEAGQRLVRCEERRGGTEGGSTCRCRWA